MKSSESLSLKHLYKRQKEIINKIQNKEYPDIIYEKQCGDFKIIRDLIKTGAIEGTYDDHSTWDDNLIFNLDTSLHTAKYLEEINEEIKNRNVLFKFIKSIWTFIRSIPPIINWIVLFLIATITLWKLIF